MCCFTASAEYDGDYCDTSTMSTVRDNLQSMEEKERSSMRFLEPALQHFILAM